MGEDLMPGIGAMYIEGRKIMDIEDATFDSITINPEEKNVTLNGTKRGFASLGPIEFTVTFDKPFFNKRLFNKLKGWKNYDRPRNRMLKRARDQREALMFISKKTVERRLRRQKERMRRDSLKSKGTSWISNIPNDADLYAVVIKRLARSFRKTVMREEKKA